jgi:hypothetical protein
MDTKPLRHGYMGGRAQSSSKAYWQETAADSRIGICCQFSDLPAAGKFVRR